MKLKVENRRRHLTQLRGRWLLISTHFLQLAYKLKFTVTFSVPRMRRGSLHYRFVPLNNPISTRANILCPGLYSFSVQRKTDL